MTSAVTVQVDDATLTSLDDLASQLERSRESLVDEAIKDWVALQAYHLAHIREGIEQADRGEFASQAEIDFIAAKYGA